MKSPTSIVGILLLLVSATWAWPGIAQEMPVEEFVRQTFIHGVPVEKASQYGESDVPVLLAMLADPEQAPHWANAAATLGAIGDPRAIDPLIALIEQGDANESVDAEVYAAKTSAIIGLGYLASRDGNDRALRYLIESVDPTTWSRRGVRWESPHQADSAARDVQLSTVATLGLAVSGRPEAAEALRSLREPAETEIDERFRATIRPTLDATMRELEAVRRGGLRRYDIERIERIEGRGAGGGAGEVQQ